MPNKLSFPSKFVLHLLSKDEFEPFTSLPNRFSVSTSYVASAKQKGRLPRRRSSSSGSGSN
jgi:hypothetical protein